MLMADAPVMALTGFIEIALVIFFAVFVAIVIYVFFFRKKDSFEHQRNLPLDDSQGDRRRVDSKRGS